MDEILHLRNPGMMIPLYISTNNGFPWCNMVAKQRDANLMVHPGVLSTLLKLEQPLYKAELLSQSLGNSRPCVAWIPLVTCPKSRQHALLIILPTQALIGAHKHHNFQLPYLCRSISVLLQDLKAYSGLPGANGVTFRRFSGKSHWFAKV